RRLIRISTLFPYTTLFRSFEVQNDSKLNHAYCILHTSLSSEICIDRAHQVGAHEALEKFNATELIEAMLRGAKAIETQRQASLRSEEHTSELQSRENLVCR